MNLEVEGKLFKVLEEQSGEGRNGRWLKKGFVIETDEMYPRKICMNLWNDKAKLLENFNVGDFVKVSINIESREYNERWYTDVTAWRLEKPNNQSAAAPMDAPLPEMDELPYSSPNQTAGGDDADDFPF